MPAMNKPHRVVPTLTEVLDESQLSLNSAKTSAPLLDLDLDEDISLDSDQGLNAAPMVAQVLGHEAEIAVPSPGSEIELDLSGDFDLDLRPVESSLDTALDLALDDASPFQQARELDPGLDQGLGQDQLEARGAQDAEGFVAQAMSAALPLHPSQSKSAVDSDALQLSAALQSLMVQAVDAALADLRESLLMRLESVVRQAVAEQQAQDLHQRS